MRYTGQNPNGINQTGTASVAISVQNTPIANFTPTSIQVTGSVVVSQSLNAYNVNAGTPTTIPWGVYLAGSVFDSYNENTPVSDILRLVAGLLKTQAPTPLPNGRTYASVTAVQSNTGTGTVSTYLPGYIPQDFENSVKTGIDTIKYLNTKGFANTGSTPYAGVGTVYIQNGYAVAFSSGTPGSSTTTSSSLGPNAFGFGSLNTTSSISGSIIYNYSDNNTPGNITATSASNQVFTILGTGSNAASGLSIATILSADPTVIPSLYQDGLFSNGFSRGIFNGGTNIAGRSSTSVSSSGYYSITASVGITSSANPGYVTRATSLGIFWAPVDQLSLDNNTVTLASSSVAFTVVSRSLSGAPYISSSTYGYVVSMSGIFDPMYVSDTNIATTNISAGGGYITYNTQNANINGGQINTDGVFFDQSGAGAARSVGSIPLRTDIARFSATASSNFSTTSNITAQGSSSNSFSIYSEGKAKNGAATSGTTVISLFTPGTFGQPSASGSMAYFGRTQGTDPGTDTLEQFYGESSRRQVSASGFDVLAFTAPNWDTTYGLYNLPAKELQVKPGFLVTPGGSYKYWLNDPFPADVFKYYVKEVTCAVTAPNNIVFSLTSQGSGITLVDWESTSNGIAVGIMFQSSTAAQLGSTARFFNLSKGGGVSGAYPAGNQYNPFASSLVIYNEGGGGGGTYTMPVTNGKGMILNGSTLTKYYVVVRYKGDPAPLTQLSISYT